MTAPAAHSKFKEQNVMATWTHIDWIPVARQLPTADDGLPLADGEKVAVWVLTLNMILNGPSVEAGAYHLRAKAFDDAEDVGGDRILFWAPCWEAAAIEGYEPVQHAQVG